MKYLTTILFLFVYFGVSAQEYTYHYIDDINFLRTDTHGFVYLVSNQSICKFDGKEVHSTCLHLDKEISDVAIVSEDEYYVAIDNTLLVYKGQDKIRELLLKDTISCLQLVNNTIVIGTGSGLYYYNIDSTILTAINVKGFINGIISLGDYMYSITDTDIYKIDTTFYSIKSAKLPEVLPKQIIAYNINEIAVLMNNGKIIFLNTNLNVTNTFTPTKFKPLEIAANNGLLYAIDDYTLQQWEHESFKRLREGDFENLTQVQSLLFTTNKNTIESYNAISAFYNIDNIFSMCLGDGQVWLGRKGKISQFDNGKLVRDIVFPNALKNAYVSSMVLHKNKIYAGTMGNGIMVFDLESGALLNKFKTIDSNPNEQNIIKLELKDNLLWVGYLNGVKVFDVTTQEQLYDFTELLKNNYLYSYHINSLDNFYLGTSDRGLIHVVHGQSKIYFEGSSVYTIVDTPYGVIFSVEGEGIFLLIGDTTSKLSDTYFFRSSNTYNIMYVDGLVLFSHDHGVDILDLKNQQMNYVSNESLNEPHLNANAVNTSNCLIGYDNGVYVFQTGLLGNLLNTDLMIKPPLLFDKEIKSDEKVFNHRDNVWTFAFEALNYHAPNDRYYKYKLSPLETQWKSTTQEKITYYNLAPGNYTFEVSSGGHRNFKPLHFKSFKFSIAKPFWMTLWFWLLAACVLVVSVYLIIKYKERQIIKKEQIKSTQIQYEYQRIKDQINPHFLFNSFNSLIGIVEESPKKATDVLEKLSSMFRTVLKYEKADIISLSEELELAMQYFEIHKIRYQDLISLNIHTIKDAHNKFVIPLSIQLLIENAIKHNIINSQSRLKIEIFDNGSFLVFSNNLNKKNNKALSLGLGLKNLIKRNEIILDKKPIIEQNQGFFTVKIPYIYG